MKRFSLIAFILIFSLLLFFPASAQSRAELIKQVVTHVATQSVPKNEWEVYGPNDYKIESLYGSGTCGGYRLTFYTNGKYWGEGAIYDCPDSASAEAIFNSTMPLHAIPTVQCPNPLTQGKISEHNGGKTTTTFVECLEKEADGTNSPKWDGPRNTAFKFVSWWQSNTRYIYPEQGIVIEGFSARTKDQTTTLATILDYYAWDFKLLSTDASASGNQNPEISAIGFSPQDPTSIDIVNLQARASDPDGDALTYQWEVDGVVQSVSKATVTWEHPEPGYHDIYLVVTDGKGGQAEEYLSLYISEHVGAGDRDDDGILDDEDQCPDEFGFIPDGCPDFTATVGCTPASPEDGDTVTCSAGVSGGHQGETFIYHWYLDGSSMTTTEAPSWTYPNATFGEHTILVQVVGEGRSTEASTNISVGGVVDSSIAGFQVVGLACSNNISSDDTLACGAYLLRENPDVGVLNFFWSIDGFQAQAGSTQGDSISFSLKQPAPGDHSIQVRASDPYTNYAQLAQTPVSIRAGRNVMIPPIAQTGAAGGTLAVAIAWTWLEWLRNLRATQEPDKPRRDVPDWMDPDRSLKDIWAADAAEEMERRGLKGYVYNPDEDRLESPEYRNAVDYAENQSDLHDRYWKQRDAIAELAKNNPNDPLWKQLDELLVNNFDKVFNNGRWDANQLQKLDNAIARLGGMELGSRFVRDYTLRDVAIDTIGQASQNTAIRILSAMLSGGKSEAVLQPLSSSYTMYKNVTEKNMSYKQSYYQAIEETKDYAKWSLVFWGAGKAVAPLAKAAAERVAKAITNKIIETYGKAGMQAIDKARQLWQTLNSPITQKGREELARQLAAEAAKTAPPIIHQEWGKPVVNFDSPNFAKSTIPSPPMNWVDKMKAMDKINPRVSTFVNDLMQRPGGPDLRSVDMIRDPADILITNDERNALKLLNSSGLREAVKDGLVPRQVIAATNHVRHKMVQISVGNAYKQLAQADPELAQNVVRIDFTGTGARPHSPAATSGFTDEDLTVVGNATPAGRQAEIEMKKLIEADLRKGYDAATDTWLGPDPKLADIHVYDGLHAKNPAPAGGYGSKELIYWQSKDVPLQARSMVPTSKGNLMVNAHPDVRPTAATDVIPAHGPMAPVPKAPFQIDIPRAKNEAARVMLNNIKAANAQMTQPLTRLDALRSEGKHVVRVWNLANSGSGKPMPPQVRMLLSWKADKTINPSPEEVNEAWNYVVDYLGKKDAFEIITVRN